MVTLLLVCTLARNSAVLTAGNSVFLWAPERINQTLLSAPFLEIDEKVQCAERTPSG